MNASSINNDNVRKKKQKNFEKKNASMWFKEKNASMWSILNPKVARSRLVLHLIIEEKMLQGGLPMPRLIWLSNVTRGSTDARESVIWLSLC